MPRWEYLCLDCGHTYMVDVTPDEEDEDLEAACPICDSMDTTRTHDMETAVDKEDLKEEDPEEAEPPAWAAYVRVEDYEVPGAAEAEDRRRRAIAEWAGARGVTLRWYKGTGWPGKGTAGRRQYQRMLADLNILNLQGIVVAHLSDLGRNVAGLMRLTRDLKQEGRELTSLSEDDERVAAVVNSSDPVPPATLAAMMNEFDSKVQMQNRQAGLQRYRAMGGKIGRKPIKIPWAKADPLVKAGVSVRAISELLGINRHTARPYIKKRREKLAAHKKPDKTPMVPAIPHPVPRPDNTHRSLLLLGEKLEETLAVLTKREEKVLRLRFGLGDGCPRTLEEVGQIFNITRERVRQIEAKALKKLGIIPGTP